MDERDGGKAAKALLCKRHEECGYIRTGDIIKDIRERLSLGQNEKIKQINGVDIGDYTEICLTELFGAKSGQSVVVIQRQDIVDPENDLETDGEFSEYAVMFSFECRSDKFFDIMLHHFFHPPLKIKNIKYKSFCNCQIRSYEETGKFLTVKDGRLTLAPILDTSDKSHLFTEYRYTGREHRNDGTIKTVYLRAYKSQSNGKYISATFFNHVKMEECCQAEKQDSVFFKILRLPNQGSGDYYYLESVLCPGTHLSWSGGKIGLKIFCNKSMVEVTEEITDVTLYL